MKVVDKVLTRLRADFDLAIITLFGACAVCGIVPFAIYRFVTGDYIAGLIDSFIVLSGCLAIVFCWRTGNVKPIGVCLAVVNTAGCIAIATRLGVAGLFWMYVTLLGNYLVISPKKAAITTVVALSFLAIHGKAFSSTQQMIMFLVTALIVSLFAYIFAQRTRDQRMQLQALASQDPLTGAQNRRAMEEELQIAIEAHRRKHTSYGLAMLDLDHFKRINDDYGHEAGDRVLITFAALVKLHTRRVDRFFRFGGEEFVLLLPGAGTDALKFIADKLCSRVQEELRCHGKSVTVSIGAATLREDEDWHEWLARADAALYRAKHDGRNRSVVDNEIGAEPEPRNIQSRNIAS